MDEKAKEAIEVMVKRHEELKPVLHYELNPLVKIGFKKLHPDAIVPKMQREGDAAFDIYSMDSIVLKPGETRSVDCGIACEIPTNYKLMVNGRSGLATRGIFCHVGTIDPNYKGMIGTILHNSTSVEYIISKGDRVGQVSLQAVVPTEFVEVTELSASVRGDKGFGSSGK